MRACSVKKTPLREMVAEYTMSHSGSLPNPNGVPAAMNTDSHTKMAATGTRAAMGTTPRISNGFRNTRQSPVIGNPLPERGAYLRFPWIQLPTCPSRQPSS